MEACKYCCGMEELTKRIDTRLKARHFINFNFYLARPIDEIISSFKSKDTIQYQDFQIFDDEAEYLKRYYNIRESRFRVRQATLEAHNSAFFPLHFHEKANDVQEFRAHYFKARKRLTILDARKSSKSRIVAMLENLESQNTKSPPRKKVSTFTWTVHDIYNPTNSDYTKALIRNLRKSPKKPKKVAIEMKNRKRKSLSRKPQKKSALLSLKIPAIPLSQPNQITFPFLPQKSISNKRTRPKVMISSMATTRISTSPRRVPRKASNPINSSKEVIFSSKKSFSERQQEKVKGFLRLKSVREHLQGALANRKKEENSKTKPSTCFSRK